jgi:hypothetical protein
MMNHPKSDTNNELTPAQCFASFVYLLATLAALWASTGSAVIVGTVLVISLIAGTAQLRLSHLSPVFTRT